MGKDQHICVLGGGAAGFFAALSAAKHHPYARVTVIEIGSQFLSKVKISGGGRCNVTNAESDIKVLAQKFPRGARMLGRLFYEFSTDDTIAWFESRGVKLKVENHGHIFPVSNNSQTIIDCLMSEARALGVTLLSKHRMTDCAPTSTGFSLAFKGKPSMACDAVIVAIGGQPNRENLDWIAALGHKIEPPVPSLFTFNMPGEHVREMMGVSVPCAIARVQGSKLSAEGPLLITHWGMSGPAILKLSAWGARELADRDYRFTVLIGWTGDIRDEQVRLRIKQFQRASGRKKIKNANPFSATEGLSSRLWDYLLTRADIAAETPWVEIGKKAQNRLVNVLINDAYPVSGKTTFKEEFVTCGGVSLKSVNPKTLESRTQPGLYFAGEVLDIDGITGGYNFQSAWTTGFVAGRLGTPKK